MNQGGLQRAPLVHLFVISVTFFAFSRTHSVPIIAYMPKQWNFFFKL